MSIVYLVCASGGSYSDHWTENLAAFTDMRTAEAYMKVKEEFAAKIKKAYNVVWEWERQKNKNGGYRYSFDNYAENTKLKNAVIDTIDFLNDDEKTMMKDPAWHNIHNLTDTDYHIETIELDVGF